MAIIAERPVPSPSGPGPARKGTDRRRWDTRFPVIVLGLVAVLLVTLTLAVTIGPVAIAPLTVWQIAISRLTGLASGEWSVAHENIVWLIRFPRVLLAAIIGAGLAVVGVAMQAAVRNPLADPYILGVSSGASVGAVLVILFGVFKFFGIYSLSVAAFLGAVFSFVLVLALAQHRGMLSPVRLILVGVALSYVLSATTSFLVFRADEAQGIRSVLFWLMGSVAGAKWSFLTLPLLALLIGTTYLVLQARPLNALIAGEETAVSLGVDTSKFRRVLMVVAAMMTGVMVALAGAIGFVGLMMPHTVRLFVGSDHRRVLPVSLLAGAIFLVWVDVLARTIVQPEEMPLGVFTAFLGGPFFLWLMRRKKSAFEGGST